jgi:hypothetical protein
MHLNFGRITKGKRTFGKRICKWGENVNMDLKNSMSVTEVVHPKVAVVQWQALVDVGKNLRVQSTAGNVTKYASQEGLRSMEFAS